MKFSEKEIEDIINKTSLKRKEFLKILNSKRTFKNNDEELLKIINNLEGEIQAYRKILNTFK